MTRRLFLILFAVLALALGAAACGGDDDEPAAEDATTDEEGAGGGTHLTLTADSDFPGHREGGMEGPLTVE